MITANYSILAQRSLDSQHSLVDAKWITFTTMYTQYIQHLCLTVTVMEEQKKNTE